MNIALSVGAKEIRETLFLLGRTVVDCVVFRLFGNIFGLGQRYLLKQIFGMHTGRFSGSWLVPVPVSLCGRRLSPHSSSYCTRLSITTLSRHRPFVPGSHQHGSKDTSDVQSYSAMNSCHIANVASAWWIKHVDIMRGWRCVFYLSGIKISFEHVLVEIRLWTFAIFDDYFVLT